MFERLALDLFGPHRSSAVLTFVTVHNLFLRLGHRIDRDYEVAAGTCKRPTTPTAVCLSAAAPSMTYRAPLESSLSVLSRARARMFSLPASRSWYSQELRLPR